MQGLGVAQVEDSREDPVGSGLVDSVWSCVSSRCLCPRGGPNLGHLGLQIALTCIDGPRGPMSTGFFSW